MGSPVYRASKRILLMLMTCLVIVAGFPGVASAQELQGNSYTTQNGAHTIEWNENWTATLEGDDDFSSMVMLESQFMIYMVMFIHDASLGLSPRAVYFSLSDIITTSFDGDPTAAVEWSSSANDYQGAYKLNMSGFEFLLYMRVDVPAGDIGGPTVQVVATPIGVFSGGLNSMQNDLLLDGAPVVGGIDGKTISEAVETGVPPGGEVAEESMQATDAAEAQAPAQAPDASLDRDGDTGRSSLERISPDKRTTEATSGRSGPGTYENNNPRYAVAYPSVWLNMADANATVGQFSVKLDSGTSVIVSFTGRATTETNRNAYFDDIVARESRYTGFVGSVKSEDRLLTATWVNENELTVLEYIFVDDTTVITVMVTIQSPRPENAIPEVQRITLNENPIIRDWAELWGD